MSTKENTNNFLNCSFKGIELNEQTSKSIKNLSKALEQQAKANEENSRAIQDMINLLSPDSIIK